MNLSQARLRIRLREVLIVLVPFVFIFSIQWLPSLTPGQTMPGDNGDSRFNLIVLENVYRALFIDNGNVFELPFFYPFHSVGGFSDLHIGSIFAYAIPRLFGIGFFASMQIWVGVGCLLNYISSYYVMRKFKVETFFAIIGSLIFAFGLPVLAQQGHVQLLWRSATPLALYFALKLQIRGKIRYWIYFIGAISISFLFGVYTGVGTFLVSALIVSSRFFVKNGNFALSSPVIESGVKEKNSKFIRFSLYGISISAFICFLYTYFEYWKISNLYQIERSVSETIFFSPKPVSWISSYMSLLWAPISRNFPQNDGYWENQLFIGVGSATALIICVYLVMQNCDLGYYVKPFLFAILGTAILVTLAGKVSFFLILNQFPGFNSIRAPGRIILVLLFPIAVLVVSIFQYLKNMKNLPAVFVLLLLLLSDMIFTVSYESKISTWTDRPNYIIEAHQEILKSHPDAILFLVPDGDSKWTGADQLDGMFAALKLNRYTLNGYSGFTPLNAPEDFSCTGVADWLRSNEETFNDRSISRNSQDKPNVLVLNKEISCLINW
jgi:hypothetical protein